MMVDTTATIKTSSSSSNSCKKQDLTAIVIGAGPSGLATSLALSNVCKKVCLVEKHATFENRGATFGMAANGKKTLEELRPGLLQYMTDRSIAGRGGTLVFVWWEMRNAFLDHVRQTDNIELYCGEEFTDIIQDSEDDGVCVTFQSGLKLTGDFLVAADGVHSDVRQQQKILNAPPVIKSDNTNFRGTLQVPDTASPELKGLLEKGMVPFFAGQGGPIYFVLFNFHERHPGRLAWILATNLEVPSDGTVTPYSIAKDHIADEAQLRILEEIFSLTNKENLKPYPKTSMVDMSDKTLETLDGRWGGKGRITLVGDAAHGMRPTDGYGGSMALEDAVVLARMIKRKKDDDDDEESIPSLLKRFEEERLPRVKKVYDNQNERYETRMREGKNPGPQSQEFLDWLFAGV